MVKPTNHVNSGDGPDYNIEVIDVFDIVLCRLNWM